MAVGTLVVEAGAAVVPVRQPWSADERGRGQQRRKVATTRGQPSPRHSGSSSCGACQSSGRAAMSGIVIMDAETKKN